MHKFISAYYQENRGAKRWNEKKNGSFAKRKKNEKNKQTKQYNGTWRKSFSTKPLEVRAGAPSRRPPGVRADLSPGHVFLLSEIDVRLHTCHHQKKNEGVTDVDIVIGIPLHKGIAVDLRKGEGSLSLFGNKKINIADGPWKCMRFIAKRKKRETLMKTTWFELGNQVNRLNRVSPGSWKNYQKKKTSVGNAALSRNELDSINIKGAEKKGLECPWRW